MLNIDYINQLGLSPEENTLLKSIQDNYDKILFESFTQNKVPKVLIQEGEEKNSITDIQDKKDSILSLRSKIKTHRMDLLNQTKESIIQAISSIKGDDMDASLAILTDSQKSVEFAKDLEKLTTYLNMYVKALTDLIREKNK